MRFLAFMALLACQSAPTGPGTLLLAPDATRDGTDGLDGPRGAAWVSLSTLARATDVIDADIVFPADADGALDVSGAPYLPTLFIQGGSVAVERYHWLAAHLASRGYVTVMPHHQGDLAFFQPDNGLWAWDALRDLSGEPGGTLTGAIDPDAPAAVMGHSLGGVVAAWQWVADPDIATLGLFASYPAASADVAVRSGSPVLALAGSADGLAEPAAVEEKLSVLDDPLYYGVVTGMIHFTWTDDPSDGDLDRDGVQEGTTADLRQSALRVVDTWLDASLGGDAEAQGRLDQGAFDGVETTW